MTGEATLLALAGILAQAGVRWAVTAAYAANHSRSAAPMTEHIDILVGALADRTGLLHALDAQGWVVRQATPDGDRVRLRHREQRAAAARLAAC